MSEKTSRKDKNQNIQVFVRLRPLNQREKDIKSLGVVEVANNREVVVRQSQQTSHTKKFTFDRAFGPNAKQVEVYQDVVSPLIEEVLAGYNCTVFAYGQTGTGKTHTMVGENTSDSTTWQNDPLAGIIPRALSQLFDELRLSNTEYTVRVSYLELYNEELFDLLSGSEDNSKLRIYEDVTRKGSNIVNGLEEITVYNKNEVYKIMAQGQERKRVACTLMNAQSSRSHTVFTIVVHMKENSPEGEELVKIGKLNLVDLAGSENISKAGSDCAARRERARECVNINQSLLTLGRVITALVERHPHIPYRESKLTRILQESLGGRTKTSIIATVSPGHKDLEETMSTLEYANRAKNIQNKPEINQKLTKKAILKEYAEEIDRLKMNLQAARDKNGIYLAEETYTEMTLKQEEQRKEIQELLLQKRAIEEEREKLTNIFSELNDQLQVKEDKLSETSRRLNETRTALDNTSRMLKTTKLHFEEQKHLVNKQRETEAALSAQAQALLGAAAAAAATAAGLHGAVDRRRNVEATNLEVTKTFREESAQLRNNIKNGVDAFTDQLTEALRTLWGAGEAHSQESIQCQEQNKGKIEGIVKEIAEAMNKIKTLTERIHEDLYTQTSTKRDELHLNIKKHSDSVELLLKQFCDSVADAVVRAKSVEENGRENMDKFVKQWYTSSTARVQSLRSAQSKFIAALFESAALQAERGRQRSDARRGRANRRGAEIRQRIEEINEERSIIEERLSKQVKTLELEKKETEERLAKWVEEEKKRLDQHVEEQRRLAEARAEMMLAEIEEEKRLLAERVDKRIKWQQEQLKLTEVDNQYEDVAAQDALAAREEAARHADRYSKLFDEGTSAISVDTEAFSRNVVELVEHVSSEMLRALQRGAARAESDAQQVVASDKSAAEQFARDTEAILTDIVRGSRATMEAFVEGVEANNATTVQELTSISTNACALAQTEANFLASQTSNLRSLSETSAQFREGLQREVARSAELEAKYLMQEFAVYKPTGETPVRQEYRYPRALAATSPHERILARFRAMRSQSVDNDDCVVIESDTETPRSDSESSISEDSAVFAAPSPPEPREPRGSGRDSGRDSRESRESKRGQSIVKCTSETDIYTIRKEQQKGKENYERVSSSKKPSRLPAPASHKKPLVDRNGTR